MDQLLPLITAIIIRLMDETEILLGLKRATLTSLFKRSEQNKKDMKNYRPIYNLPFKSKLIENVVARRIEEHLEHNYLNESYQSGFVDVIQQKMLS